MSKPLTGTQPCALIRCRQRGIAETDRSFGPGFDLSNGAVMVPYLTAVGQAQRPRGIERFLIAVGVDPFRTPDLPRLVEAVHNVFGHSPPLPWVNCRAQMCSCRRISSITAMKPGSPTRPNLRPGRRSAPPRSGRRRCPPRRPFSGASRSFPDHGRCRRSGAAAAPGSAYGR